MRSPHGTGVFRGRDESRRDLVLSRLLAEPPRPLLGYGPAAELARLSRDRATPAVTRRLLGRQVEGRTFGLFQDVLKQHPGGTADMLFTLLTRAHRDVALPDGTSWLLVVAESEPASSARSVAWAQIGEPGRPGDLVRDFEVYPLPTGFGTPVEPLREELALLALQTGWRPRAPLEERALVVLGPRAAEILGQDTEELVARAAVEGVHLTVVPVPADSSTRAWQQARQAALEVGGPTIAVLAPLERGTERLIHTLRDRYGRLVACLPTPATAAGVIHEVLALLAPPQAPVADLPEPAQPPPATESPPPRRVTRVVYLAKTGAATGRDVLQPTAHRCGHKKTRPVSHGNAPKKYKGVIRYLARQAQDARLVSAVICKTPGCGLVTAHYEVGDSEDPALVPVRRRAPPRGGSASGEALEDFQGRLAHLVGCDAVEGAAGVVDGPGGGEGDGHRGGGRVGERARGFGVGQLAGARGELEVVTRSGHRVSPRMSAAGARVRLSRRARPQECQMTTPERQPQRWWRP